MDKIKKIKWSETGLNWFEDKFINVAPRSLRKVTKCIG